MPPLHLINGLLCGAALLAAEPGDKPVYGVKVEPDVVYSVAEGYWTETSDKLWEQSRLLFKIDRRKPLELKLDIYLPADDNPMTARPLMLMMHGGAYFIGHKTELGQVEWCRYFASLGYVAVSLDYRLGYHIDKSGFTRAERDAVEDAENALQYLLGREDLRIDRQQVYLAGTSAGAAISLSMAYDSVRKERNCRIRAVANLWGYVHNLDILENACIPILSFQSEKDPLVPYTEGYPKNLRFLMEKAYGTLAVYERATALGIPCEHHPCPEKHHRLHLDSQNAFTPWFYEIRDRMAAFFAAAGSQTSL